MKIREKEYLDQNVWDKSKDRIRYLYDRFDKVIVCFSAGKDSTAVLHVALEVAKELKKLPLKVVFFDEEAIHPPTIDYARRVSKNPDIDFEWYCLEVKHRNACSNEEPFWYCWDKDKKDKWIYDLPKEAITEHPEFVKGESFQDFSDHMFPQSWGSIALITGVRTQESFRRMKAVSTKKNDNYIAGAVNGNLHKCHPIYDWSSEDVWLAVHKFGWDYNKTYDIFNQTKLYNKFLTQRVCPPFGEEPLRGLWIYAECFPDMWHKMLDRVKGVATAWRYANTELYGIGKRVKPDDLSYKEWAEVVLESYDASVVNTVKSNINSVIKRHYDKTNDLIPEENAHPLTGTSWAFICKLAIKGDFKGRTAPALEGNAIAARKKIGIESFDQSIRMYGKQEFKEKRFNKGK